MSGVTIIRGKLAAYAPLLAVVPAARIKEGELPLKTTVPAISITQISSSPRWTVSMPGTNVLNTDRVQVTVMTSGTQGSAAGTGYPGLRAILKLVLAACGNSKGTVNGVLCDAILPEAEGPDFFNDDPALCMGSRDFMVRWVQP